MASCFNCAHKFVFNGVFFFLQYHLLSAFTAHPTEASTTGREGQKVAVKNKCVLEATLSKFSSQGQKCEVLQGCKEAKKKVKSIQTAEVKFYSLRLEFCVHKKKKKHKDTHKPRCHGIFCGNLFVAVVPGDALNENYLSSGKAKLRSKRWHQTHWSTHHTHRREMLP